MGSYNLMSHIPQCHPDKVETLRTAIKEMTNIHLREIFFDNLEIMEDGSLEYSDYYQNWHHCEEFAKFLAPFLTAGRLSFRDDDNEWGFEFDGIGNVYELIFTIERGAKL